MRKNDAAAARRLNKPAEIDLSLKHCPFCAAPAQVEFWHGGRPSKRMVSCSSDTCEVRPMVTGHTYKVAAARWNMRLEPVDF
jgi:hypothetical protein